MCKFGNMIIKNKHGWIKIAEAFIAIILISVVVLTLYSQQKIKTNDGSEIIKTEDSILNELVNSEQLRTDILMNNTVQLESFIRERTPSGFNFTIRICELNDACAIQDYHPEIFARDRIVSSTLEEYSPKRIKLFIWER